MSKSLKLAGKIINLETGKIVIATSILLTAILMLGSFFICNNLVSATSTTLFSDGFESNNFSKWTSAGNKWEVKGGNVHGGEKKAEIKGNTGGDEILSKNQSTIGYENIVLSYWFKIDKNLESNDHLFVEWSIDSQNWNVIYDYTNQNAGDWNLASFNLPSGADNNSNFTFRFRANLGSGNDVFWLDDVFLTGETIPTTGSLTVIKNTIGGDGTFQMQGSGGIGSFSITTTNNTGSKTFDNLTPGTYSITETVPDGWQKTSDDCSNVSVVAGQTATCTIENTKLASITVIKDVVAPDGQTDVSDNHIFYVTLNGADQKEFSENSSAFYSNLLPGQQYTIAEIEDQNYDLISISGDCNSDGTITLSAGQDAQCTITNAQKKGTLKVNKRVINKGIGTADANDFSFTINDGDPIQFEGEEGDLEIQQTVEVDPGTYNIIELNNLGYAVTYENCGNVEVTSNGEAVCNITNSDLEPGRGAITVRKEVINDNGGNKNGSDFVLNINGFQNDDEQTPVNISPATQGQAYQLLPGTYTVTESNLPDDYIQRSIECYDGETLIQGSGGTINLEEGHVYTCIITNDDLPGKLIVKKILTQDNGGKEKYSDFSFSVNNGDSINFEEDGENELEVNAGTYTIVETETKGYTPSYDNCTNVSISNGQTATCTITNDDIQPLLTVIKKVINDNNGTKQVSDFPLFVGGIPVTSGEQRSFNAGTYVVSETNQEGYTATFSGDCAADGSITLNPGDVKTCIITNDDIVTGGGGMRGIASEPTLRILDFGSPVITTNALAVTWDTNLPASSYVIYSAEGEPHELDISNTFGNPPTYGYAHATPEINIDPKVTSHIVVVTGLQPLTTYYFRAVSRGSLVISPEYKVTLPAVAGTATVAEGVEGGTTTSESGKSSSETGTTQEELTTTENTEEGNLSTGEETNLLQTEENSGGEQSNISTETPNPFVAGFAFVANHYLWLVLIVLVIIAVGYFIYYSINKKK